jgi:acetylornithine deacetylase/succinyl-diaminopimelate desuccinylase-like protein
MSSTYYDDAVSIKPELVSFMQDIIRIPSLSSEEGAVVERIREEMLRIGYESAIRTSGIATRIRAISRAISSTDAAQAI